MASVVGLNKVFILDKYFTELTKYWQSEYQLQEKQKCSQQPNYNYSQYQQNINKFLESSPIANINDLIHLDAPITEDSLIRALQSRFMANECFTNIGPVLISINAFNDQSNALTLNSTHQNIHCSPLLRVVHEAVRQQTETGYPQAIILSGTNGSGKTYSSMVILRQLFNVVGGGPETDAFKHLAAAFTVLRSLGSAKTINNSESSRIGNFIEVQVTDGAIYRTKIHCYFLDQSRVVKTPPNERNYHIFYQMLAGLSPNEKTKLYLDGYSISDFNYLNCGSLDVNFSQDVTRFQAWKSCLSVLGIPFMDVVRVLAAVLLLGNIQFEETHKEGHDTEAQHSFKKEIHAVANLLGVSSATLVKGFTTVTYCSSKGQIIRSRRTPSSSKNVRDSLSKALYIRTVATIIRRANSSKRLGSSCGTTSSESNESIHNHLETGSHHAPSSIGSACGKSYKTMAVLNNAVRYAMDGFIGILDMFGFEDGRLSRLEQLCINLCAETMQHFYNTHIFKASIESCRDEGVKPEIEIDYVDNVPCIDFISSLRTGLFSLLDVECRKGGSPEALVEKIKAQHYGSARYFEVTPRCKSLPPGTTSPEQLKRYFGIRHFVGDVVYDTSHFIEANSDKLCDDIISVFHKAHCSFGFVSHLFGAELRLLNSKGAMPRGLKFRVAPTSHLDQNSTEPACTLSQDFHNRLDNLLRTLVHARPHFVRCIKINDIEQSGYFDRASVMKQVRALQILETVNLMAGGLPHRMRFKAFNLRYRLLVPFKLLKRNEESMTDDCQLILSHFEQRRSALNCTSAASISWVLGKKHIFLSESARQQLELVRNDRRISAAILIQSTWRGHQTRRKWPYIKQNLLFSKSKYASINASVTHSLEAKLRPPRPQPITGTPPPFGPQPTAMGSFPTTTTTTSTKAMEMCDFSMVREACALFGIDLNTPPPLPPCRAYTVVGNTKCYFPQVRVIKMDYQDPVTKLQIAKGQRVLVRSASAKRGYLSVEHHSDLAVDVPHHFFEILSVPASSVALCI